MKSQYQNGTFMFNRKDLSAALKIAQRASVTKGARPVLQYALVKPDVDGQSLYIYSTDLDNGVRVSFGIDGDNCSADPFAMHIGQAHRFLSDNRADTCTVRPDGSVVVMQLLGKENNVISTARLGSVPIDQMPHDQMHEEVVSDTINGESLASAIRSVVSAVATEAVQYAMTGVCWDVSGGQINIAGTDTHRLHAAAVHGNADTDGQAAYVMMRSTAELIAEAAHESGTCRLYLGEKRVHAVCGNVSIYGTMIQGRYPKYKDIVTPVFDDSRRRCIDIDRESLAGAAKRSSLFEGKDGVEISIAAGGEMSVSSTDGTGTLDNYIGVEQGHTFKAVVCSKYIVDAMAAVGDCDVVKMWYAPGDGFSKQPIGIAADNKLSIVIMPIGRG